MARKKPPTDVQPLFPIKHEFGASLDRFVHEAGMLADAVRTLLGYQAVTGPVRKLLEERLAAFRLAQFGVTDDEDEDKQAGAGR